MLRGELVRPHPRGLEPPEAPGLRRRAVRLPELQAGAVRRRAVHEVDHPIRIHRRMQDVASVTLLHGDPALGARAVRLPEPQAGAPRRGAVGRVEDQAALRVGYDDVVAVVRDDPPLGIGPVGLPELHGGAQVDGPVLRIEHAAAALGGGEGVGPVREVPGVLRGELVRGIKVHIRRVISIGIVYIHCTAYPRNTSRRGVLPYSVWPLISTNTIVLGNPLSPIIEYAGSQIIGPPVLICVDSRRIAGCFNFFTKLSSHSCKVSISF